MAEELPTYRSDQFRLADDAPACDLVMKGGVTSGVVYPYAILEIATRNRLKGIGGTSAGAIASAFAAAAEYARQNGDPEGFVRLQTHCETLPDRLSKLFQPEPTLAPLMHMLLDAAAGRGPVALTRIWGSGLIGAVLGATLLAGGFHLAGVAGWPLWAAALIGLLLGGLAGLALRLWRLLQAVGRHDFGICTGRTVGSASDPALTDWIYACLQDIAFGSAGRAEPLTFGDLDGKGVTLRMVTTSLSLRRPFTLPDLPAWLHFSPQRWGALFPDAVVSHLTAKGHARGDHVSMPPPGDLPVVVGVRMSLSFPILITAVPMVAHDLGPMLLMQSQGLAPESPRTDTPMPGVVKMRASANLDTIKDIWFTDGGISSNFPIHFFDGLVPRHPTFALSLDEAPADLLTVPGAGRVLMSASAAGGSFLPIMPTQGLAGFAGAIFGAAKDWQDNVQSIMPAVRDRVIRVFLTKEEGGLNLNMPPERSRLLMGYGLEAGRKLAGFNFDEHCWKRALVAYDAFSGQLGAANSNWPTFSADLSAHKPLSYPEAAKPARRAAFMARLAALTALGANWRSFPGFPSPKGRVKIDPRI